MTAPAPPWLSGSTVFEHDDFFVINKPTGVDVHSSDGTAGLVATLEAHWQQKLYLIHRLDKVTSGLLLLGRNSHSAGLLARQFAERRIEKYYLAISANKPNKKQGMIKGDMLKSRGGRWKLAKTQESPAITQFYSTAIGDNRRLFLLRPKTGRTHQLRVMMKSLGSPIQGDRLYGGGDGKRVYLHANALRFGHKGEHYAITQLPEWEGLRAQQKLDLDLPWSMNWPGDKSCTL